ncbi:MAG: PQQ-dependent sugar dehydrogenase [Phycisphaerales bacterium]|nr:PQQ-dependent sugar dehydrogenase [Phycisphaerales bacterium]
MKNLTFCVATGVLAALAGAQSLQPFVSGLDKPVDFASDPTDEARFYVVEQSGRVRVVEHGQLLAEPFFEVDRSNFEAGGWEQGLLGIALDPKFADNRRVYLNFTGAKGATHIVRVVAESAQRADPASQTLVLTFAQPWNNHNGGCIRFGPDGMLWIGTGDGGAANDPQGNGQKLDTLLGKMLRIDVSAEPDEGLSYAVPKDNPFVGREGVRPEIWAYGLRNPWRFEFDSLGRLWIADVGQNRYEEIHLQSADSKGGENYGWNVMEGFGEFRPGGDRARDPKKLTPEEHKERGFVAPIHAYRHDPDGSITGGYFYEGEGIPALKGRYIFAEFQRGRIWSFKVEDGKATDLAEHTQMWTSALGGKTPLQRISSFGRDNAGELYVLDVREGKIWKMVE